MHVTNLLCILLKEISVLFFKDFHSLLKSYERNALYFMTTVSVYKMMYYIHNKNDCNLIG